MLVLAGAGSGKTQVIISRIVNLIKRQKIPAEQILAVTFTNKAAKEMQERVKTSAGKLAEGMIISTFHSLGVRILRRDIKRSGYRANFSIYGESDQSGVIRQAMGDLGLDPKKTNPDLVRWSISMAKNRLIWPEEYTAAPGDPLAAAVKMVYPRYQQLLQAYNAIDFDDIIMMAVRLLEAHHEAAEYWQQRFTQIMVDEYQDTNACQYRLISLLAEKHNNLCVVGDDDQAIYGWRGADVSNILSFAEARPGCTLVKLEQNYRSTGTILAAANAVIGNNKLRSDKALWTASGKGDPINLLVAADEEEEARMVVEQIQMAQYRHKLPWRDFAVLYRSNSQSRVFEEVLRIEGIPYILVGGQRFFERKEVKDALSYLTVLHNPQDEAALVRILNFPRRGIGDTTLMRLQQWSLEHDAPLHVALSQVEEISGITEAAKSAITSFNNMLQAEIRSFGPPEMGKKATALFRRLGINEEMWRTQADAAQARKRIENIEQVINALSAFEERNPGATLGSFLERISLLEDNRREADDGKGDGQDSVTLMSLHASKGLEFPSVFLVGMEEGLLPHHRSADEDPTVAEERRLCYVGITRAKERLTISRCLTRRKYGTREERFPSRFLAEIPEQLLQGTSGVETAKTGADLGNDFLPECWRSN